MNLSVNFVSSHQDDERPGDRNGEREEPVGEDSDDELAFLRAVTTRSGRARPS